ncbi:Leucine aminopeptidase 1 [Fusarium oxysporum f. sp. albedinis]|nr:Leucine aminopeptidase 1 [Fusarium oxysporum f. sp. albedinis]
MRHSLEAACQRGRYGPSGPLLRVCNCPSVLFTQIIIPTSYSFSISFLSNVIEQIRQTCFFKTFLGFPTTAPASPEAHTSLS